MALTRSFLKAMGLNDEQVNSVIEAHTDTIDALKKERDDWKGKAETVETLTRERDEAVEKLSKAGDVQKVQKEFDDYKQQVEDERKYAVDTSDLLDIANAAGIRRPRWQEIAARDFDRSKIKRGEDNAITNRDELIEVMKSSNADFIVTSEDKPVPPNNPPAGGGQTFTKADIEKMTPDEINKNWEAISKGLSNLK